MDVTQYRQHFPITENYVYFNHAAVAPAHLLAQARLQAYLEDAKLGTIAELKWFEQIEQVRAAAAQLVNAQSQEITFVPNASTGAALIANGLQWPESANIIVPWNQFPANVYPWLNLKNRGVAVRTLQVPHDDSWLDVIRTAVDRNTRLVALSWVEFADGFRYDMDRLGEFCRSQGILSFVDAIQGLGGMHFDVRETPVDFLATSGHKWLLGPLGLGFLYIRDNHLEDLYVTTQSWRSVAEPWDFYNYRQPFQSGAKRFEGGTPNLNGILWLGTSLDMILALGSQAIEKRILALTAALCDGLKQKHYQVTSYLNNKNRSGIVSFKHQRLTSKELVAALAAKNIILSDRDANLRASPHFYNTETEIDALLSALP